jgi:hypothetical protein
LNPIIEVWIFTKLDLFRIFKFIISLY